MMINPYNRYPFRSPVLVFATELEEPMQCVIRNISEGGAMLAFHKSVRLPRRVYVTRGKGDRLLECEVRWRNCDRLFGMRFASTNSRQALHNLVRACALSDTSPNVD